MEPLTNSEQLQLENDGYLALPGIIDPECIGEMKARLEVLLAATKQDHAGTLIVSDLFDDAVFDIVWQHPRVLGAVRHLLGADFRLTGVSSRGLRPGHGQQALHSDWVGQGDPGVWYLCHAICPLVDFTSENGATRVIPGSHRNPWMLKGLSDLRKPYPAQQLIGSAGTVFILNVHCAHSAVHNASSEPRHAIFSSFSRRDSPLLLQMSVPEPSAESLARYSSDIRALWVN
ncbi:MAG: phytanoyl-CoA dioxygenase family protein [Chloroflexota bacterium]